MSTGTNSERIIENNNLITQNNTNIQKAIDKASNLPDAVGRVYSKTDYYEQSYTGTVKLYTGSNNPAVSNGKIFIYTSGTTIYCYYDGELKCTGTCSSGAGNNNNIVKITDDYCIFIMKNNSNTYTTAYVTYKFDFKENTCTKIGNITTPTNSGIESHRDLVINSTRIVKYNETTNTFSDNITTTNSTCKWIAPYIAAHSTTVASPSTNNIFKFIYNSSTSGYDYVSAKIGRLYGINFYQNKAFINGNVYKLNADLTVGELLKENAFLLVGEIHCINDTYYTMSNRLYSFNETTNTFTQIPTTTTIQDQCSGYEGQVYYLTNSSKTRTNFIFEDSDKLIAFSDKNSYAYISNYPVAKSGDLIEGLEVYNIRGEHLQGTMPNNGALNYTPSTSEQTIPAGYTSGGKVSAIEDANLLSENIKSGVTILGVTGDTNVIDTSVSFVDPEYSTSGSPLFVLNQSTGYYEVEHQDSSVHSVLEMSFTNSNVSDITLNYEGSDLATGESIVSVYLDEESVAELDDAPDYTDYVIENVSAGNHTISIEVASDEPGMYLSIKMLPISESAATTSDVLKGKVAYINGTKIVGTHEDGEATNYFVPNGMKFADSTFTTIPSELHFERVTDMSYMFSNCSNLSGVPLLDVSSATNMYGIFLNCLNLSDNSLNNILAMCANATSMTSNKTLNQLGLTSSQATTCTTLSNYQDFLNAGWTTGY